MADSFFYEASLRKKGYHFNGTGFGYTEVLAPLFPLPDRACFIDTNKILKDDVMAFFYWGMEKYNMKDYSNAVRIFKKIIAVEKNNPLVYHYMGKIFYDQGKWENAEVMFKLAFENYKDSLHFMIYRDSVINSKRWPYPHDCVEAYFKDKRYESEEDHYFISSVYEKWGHFEEAEQRYRIIISLDSTKIDGYVKVWRIMEKLGRFNEAEKMIQEYRRHDKDYGFSELTAFYKRAMERYPGDANWSYKLGLLLYERADWPSVQPYLDTIIFFPLLNKEVFMGVEEHNGAFSNDKMLLEKYRIDSINQVPQSEGGRTSLTRIRVSGWQTTFPGTKEKVLMDPGTIYTPRKDAITYLSKAADMIKEPETVADIDFKIGNVYVWAGSKKQAYPFYDMAIKMSPENAPFRMKMVDIAHDLFRNRVALENLEYLYEQKQINFDHQKLLAEFDIHAGKFDTAKKILDEVEAIYPYNVPEIQDLNGRLFLLSKQFEKALPMYRQYLAENNNDKKTVYTIARLYALMKNDEEAWKWLEDAMKKGFNYSWVLQYDPTWENYRGSQQWKDLMARYPDVRTYVSTYKN